MSLQLCEQNIGWKSDGACTDAREDRVGRALECVEHVHNVGSRGALLDVGAGRGGDSRHEARGEEEDRGEAKGEHCGLDEEGRFTGSLDER